MARLTRTKVNVPEDLRTFVSRRWIKDALDCEDDRIASVARNRTRAEVYRHRYAILIVAPARYRAALWATVGQDDGNRHYEEVMNSPAVRRQRLAVIQTGNYRIETD